MTIVPVEGENRISQRNAEKCVETHAGIVGSAFESLRLGSVNGLSCISWLSLPYIHIPSNNDRIMNSPQIVVVDKVYSMQVVCIVDIHDSDGRRRWAIQQQNKRKVEEVAEWNHDQLGLCLVWLVERDFVAWVVAWHVVRFGKRWVFRMRILEQHDTLLAILYQASNVSEVL